MPYKDKDKQREAQRKYEQQRSKRFTTWMCIFYEESAPTDWREQLSELQVRLWVSPSHDKDVWRETDEQKDPAHKAGTYKKAHRHVILQFDHARTMDDAWHILGVLNGPHNIKRVEDLTASVRYLTHKDDPNKAQYEAEDVLCFGGADLDALESIGTGERHIELARMRKFIREHCIVDYYVFVDYCDQCESAWQRLLDDNSTYVIERYIASIRAAKKDGTYQEDAVSAMLVDPATGEVLNGEG